MRTILYMATSLTGKITSGENDTSWVEESDVERMDTEMVKCGVMVMGRTTYDSFGGDLPLGKALLVVMTHDKDLLSQSDDKLIFTDSTPKEILNMLEAKGYTSVLLAGGENLNSSFLKTNLIDEIRVIVKPLIIGNGKSLFNLPNYTQKLTFTTSTLLPDGVVELAYKVH